MLIWAMIHLLVYACVCVCKYVCVYACTYVYICVLQLVKELEMKTLMRGYETKMRGYAMKSIESVSPSQGDTDL